MTYNLQIQYTGADDTNVTIWVPNLPNEQRVDTTFMGHCGSVHFKPQTGILIQVFEVGTPRRRQMNCMPKAAINAAVNRQLFDQMEVIDSGISLT